MLKSTVSDEGNAAMDDNTGRLTRLALLCGQCNCGCPELLVDHEAPPEQRIVITDDFGQRVQMSEDQLLVLIEEARSGRLGAALSGLASQFSAGGCQPAVDLVPAGLVEGGADRVLGQRAVASDGDA